MSKVLIFPDPLLRKTSLEIIDFEINTKKLSEDLLETMIAYEGIGLAAPQIGVLQRMFVMNLENIEDIKPNFPKVFINPIIIEKTKEEIIYQEGCLSIPNIRANIKRKKTIHLSYQDLQGRKKILKATNLAAVCIQHEIDHLNGILFLDHLEPLERKFLINKYNKKK